MTDYLFYLLLGTGGGAIIAGLGLGLVVTYQGAGVVNFSLGAMAMWVSFVYADLREGDYPLPVPGLPERIHLGGDVGLPLALILALATAAGLGLTVHFLVFRPLRQAPALASIVASIGVLVMLMALVERRFSGRTNLRVGSILPREPVRISDNLTVPRDGLWLLAIVTAIAFVLWFISTSTRLGLIARAAAENERAAVLLGLSPDRLAAGCFMLASMVAGLVGILAAPMIQLNTGVYTFGFFIPALGAALVGKFRSPWITLIAGASIGMVQSTFTKLQGDLSWFPKYGAREGLPFLVIILAMVIRGEGLPGRGNTEQGRLPSVPPSRVTLMNVAVPVAAAVIGLLAFGPLWRGAVMTSIIAAVIALSFVVLTGFGGQTSLAQLTFAGIAGFMLSRLADRWGIPFPIAPVLAAGAAALVGLLIGLPTLRVRGTNLAIVTLAGGLAVSEFVFKNPDLVGDGTNVGATIGPPKLGSWNLGLVDGSDSSRPIFGMLLLTVLVVLCLAVANLRRSATGRRILAVRSNERAASSIGINVAGSKVLMFAISGSIAGMGGSLIAYRFGSVSDVSFGTVASLTALAVAYLGGITSVSGAVTSGVIASSGVFFFASTEVFGAVGQWEVFISGAMLIVITIRNPEGLAGALSVAGRKLARRFRRPAIVPHEGVA